MDDIKYQRFTAQLIPDFYRQIVDNSIIGIEQYVLTQYGSASSCRDIPTRSVLPSASTCMQYYGVRRL